MIAKRSIERVFEAAKAEEVVGNFVSLKRRGVNFIGLCPFHNEKTPSFTVSPAKNIYKCFGCGRGGNAVNFVMEHEGYSYIEAIKFLAQMYHIELEELEMSDEQKDNEKKRDSLFIVNTWAKERFSDNLFKTQQGVNIGLSYFKERGFRESLIKKFDLGFAVNDYTDLTDAAKRDGYNIDFAKELGLISSRDADFFRNRVMFTIHNLTGKAIGFAGRIMGNNPKLPKYINSPESEIYNKRKILYGLYFAKNEIRKLDYCILVEGYTDVLSLYQSGIENVVASSGTSLTTDQIRLIKRYTNTVKILYDGDSAGINAALRGMEMILAENMIVKLAILPENHDPDSFIKEVGPTEFLSFVEKNEKDFVLFKTKLLLEETSGDPVKKAYLLKDIVATLAKVPDPLIRSMYVKECSSILDIEEKIIVQETNKLIKKEIRDNSFKQRRNEDVQKSMDIVDDQDKIKAQPQTFLLRSDEHQEKAILKVLMEKGHLYFDEEEALYVVDYILMNIIDVLKYFENKSYKSIIQHIIQLREKNEMPSENYYLNNDRDDIREMYINLVMSPYDYANWSERGFELQTQKHPDLNHVSETNQAVMRLNYKKISQIIKENNKKMAEGGYSEEEYLTLLKLHNKLIARKREMAEILNIVIQ